MVPGYIVFIEAIILTLILVVMYYYLIGWKEFSYSTGDNITWPSDNVGSLRFKNCTFTVNMPDGTKKTKDVTDVLNGMAVAYNGSQVTPPSLALTGPLNAFSFTISGFNDSVTVRDPTASPWCLSTKTCTAPGDCPYNSCSNGYCVICPGAPKVTLTGSYKQL